MHARVFDHAGPGSALALTRNPRFAFRSLQRRRRPDRIFRGALAGLSFPCRRIAHGRAAESARLGANVVRYAFTAVDRHHRLRVGLPGAPLP